MTEAMIQSSRRDRPAVNPQSALAALPPAAIDAFREEQARISSIRALMDAILLTEAEIQQNLHVNVARITMVGQILVIQKQALPHGKIGDWFVTNFGNERMRTMQRWHAVGEAVQQKCPELAQRTGQMLLAQQASPDELAAVGESVLTAVGVDSLTRLYAWAATVRNPPQKKRERPPAPVSAEKKAQREVADLTEHLADLKQVLHVLSTPRVKAAMGRLAEQNTRGFVRLRDDLTEQWSQFAAALKTIKVK